MEIYQAPIFILGATAFAAGVCQNYGENALIADSGDLPAAEFAAALHSDGLERAACHTAAGIELQNDLLRRGILADSGEGLPHLPAVQPVMCRFFYTSGARFLFRSQVLSIHPAGTGWRIRLFTTGGLREVAAEQILDTTAAGVVRRFFPHAYTAACTRSLNAILYVNHAVEFCKIGKFSLYPGALAKEGYLHFALAPQTTCVQAHELLYRAWEKRTAPLHNCRIAYAAPILDTVPTVTEIQPPPHISWAPSVNYGNVVRAFDAGAEWPLGREVPCV